MERGAFRLEKWRGSDRVEVLDGLEAGAKCQRFPVRVYRLDRLGTGVSSRSGKWISVCTRRRRHGVEGGQNDGKSGCAHQTVWRVGECRQYFRFRPSDGRQQRKHLLQRNQAEYL